MGGKSLVAQVRAPVLGDNLGYSSLHPERHARTRTLAGERTAVWTSFGTRRPGLGVSATMRSRQRSRGNRVRVNGALSGKAPSGAARKGYSRSLGLLAILLWQIPSSLRDYTLLEEWIRWRADEEWTEGRCS